MMKEDLFKVRAIAQPSHNGSQDCQGLGNVVVPEVDVADLATELASDRLQKLLN